MRRLLAISVVWGFLLADPGLAIETAAPSSAPPISIVGETSDSALSSHVPGEVLVRFASDATRGDVATVLDDANVTVKRRLRLRDVRLLRLPPGSTVAGEIAALERRRDVVWAEPNYYVHTDLLPDDPLLSQEWGLHNFGQEIGGNSAALRTVDADIDAPEAWNTTTGDPEVLVAVVDGGIAYDHPDLAPNIATNPGESGGGLESNGIDDDGNGLVDDWHGWDFFDGDNDPRDLGFFAHGTVVASVLGARGGDGTGIAGVVHHARLLPIRTQDREGGGTMADLADAFSYAASQGARVVNASISGTGASQAVSDAISAAPNTLFVVTAGNVAGNDDVTPRFPCAFPQSNIICVASSTPTDGLASFSSYGPTSVDLAAPGVGILGADPAYLNVFADDFETNIAGRWTTGGAPDSWARTTAQHSSGSFSITDSPGGDYAEEADNFASTQSQIDLAGRTGCELRYKLRLDSETDFDFLFVEASENGSDWSLLNGYSGSSGGEFLTFDEDLEPYDGGPVYVRFNFVSDSTNADDGAYVDDVAVRCLTSSYGDEEFIFADGTSFSAPMVAGTAALIESLAPELSPTQVKDAIVAGTDPEPDLAGIMASGGRLNAAGALAHVPPNAVTGPVSRLATSAALVEGVVEAHGNPTTSHFEYGTTLAYGSRTPDRGPANQLDPHTARETLTGLAPGTTYHYRLVAEGPAGRTEDGDAAFTTRPGPDFVPGSSAPPRISDAKVITDKRGNASVRFRVSRPALATALVASSRLRLIPQRRVSGLAKIMLPKLRPGRHVVSIAVEDDAHNSAPLVTRVFHVGKRKRGRRGSGKRHGSRKSAASSSVPPGTQTKGGALVVTAGEASPGYDFPPPSIVAVPPGSEQGPGEINRFQDTGIVPEEWEQEYGPGSTDPEEPLLSREELAQLEAAREEAEREQRVMEAPWKELRGEDAARRAEEFRRSARQNELNAELLGANIPPPFNYISVFGPALKGAAKAQEYAAEQLDKLAKEEYAPGSPLTPKSSQRLGRFARASAARPSYERIAQPHPAKLRRLRRARGLSAAALKTANSYLSTESQAIGALGAFSDSIGRARAAAGAHRTDLLALQVQAARLYARQAAQLLGSAGKLLARLSRSLDRSPAGQKLSRSISATRRQERSLIRYLARFGKAAFHNAH